MLDFILATYIIGVVFFGGLYSISLWKMGGFQGFADLFNGLGAGTISSNYVQWMVAAMTFAWFIFVPATIAFIILGRKLEKDGG
jgi:hypothetical protein